MADFTCDPTYLAPTGFKVSLDRKNYPNIQFFAQQVQHPSMDMNATEVAYRRVGSVVTPGDTITFSNVSMDILMDENMNVYQEIYDWMRRLVEEEYKSNTGRMYANNAESIGSFCDINVSVLTSHNNVSRTIKYVNALPTTLGDVQFAATNQGDYITFPVSFRFDYFELI
jgi:hypothetical protein